MEYKNKIKISYRHNNKKIKKSLKRKNKVSFNHKQFLNKYLRAAKSLNLKKHSQLLAPKK